MRSIFNLQYGPSYFLRAFVFLAALYMVPVISYSQDEAPAPAEFIDSTTIKKNSVTAVDSLFKNEIAGEFSPGKGFDIVKTKFGSLNISGYAVARWVGQFTGESSDTTYIDHLDRTRTMKLRNDIYIHRVFIWLTGFVGTPRFRYNLSIWGLVPTQQALIFANLQYAFGPGLRLGVGIGPNVGLRSLQGSFPFFNASDRQLGEESLRPGFTGSFWVTGEMLPRFYYTAAIGDNLSILGVKADQLTGSLTTSASLWWMPTTGEFGPRGGSGDLENHKTPATRFGVSFVHARDGKLNSINDSTTINTQVKISDGVNFFERGSLAPGVTLKFADYDFGSIDLGFKYKGFFFQAQYIFRNLSKFDANGPLPISKIMDNIVQVDVAHMIIPYTLNAYVSGTYMWDEFKRNPHEIAAGLSYYPFHSRSLRLNAHCIFVDKSSAGSLFGFYTAGLTGQTFSLGCDVLF